MSSDLRDWQKECLARFEEMRGKQEVFVFEACPGAGKSRMAAELAESMLDPEKPDRVDLAIVIVPWTAIQGDKDSGMTKTFDRAGLSTRDKLMMRGARIVEQPVPNREAVITTYSEAMCEEGVDTVRLWVRKGLKVALILDEIHHANELNGTWGEFAEEMEPLASTTIVMSGTFFRTDQHPIKFVKYHEDGRPILSLPAYSYSRGVSDRVVRPVSCRFTDVQIKGVDNVEGVSTEKLSSYSSNDKRFGKIMREVFHPDGESVREMIVQIDDHMRLTRNRFHDAGCLITCRPGRNESSEDKHVHQIADRIKRYTGQEVVTVTHVDKSARNKIDTFRNSRVPYLVAVNMVSEGVDIPRLRAVAFMRHIESELMFRQIVGRAIRYTDDEDGTHAMVFLPKFQRMAQFADNMMGEALTGMRDLRCRECGQYPCVCPCRTCGQDPCVCPPPPPPPPRTFEFDVVEATPFSDGGTSSGEDVFEKSRLIARLVMRNHPKVHGHANDINLGHAIQTAMDMHNSAEWEKPKDDPLTPLERLTHARKRVNRLMQRLAGKVYGGDFQKCWVQELMEPYKADWNTVKNTWTVYEIEQLVNRLEERLVEAFKNGR